MIDQERARIAAHSLDPFVAPSLPDYFVDRFAFQAHPLAPFRCSLPSPQQDPGSSRCTFLSQATRPSVTLCGWQPEPAESTRVGPLYRQLRLAWNQFCIRHGLPEDLGMLADAASMTWRDVLDDTVHYPGPPVFRGATFIDGLAPDSADHLLREVGYGGIVDFFCFMGQVHERVHRCQTGEPLLNEVIQAAIWARFLSEEGLWGFQRDSDRTLVREIRIVREFPELFVSALECRLDTAKMTASFAAKNAYFAFCLLANRFDAGFISYDKYLNHLAKLLRIREDKRALEAATRLLL